MLGAKDANLEHVLKEKELELGTKDAHLRMLRSRLDMADRDAEEMRRKLDAANARLAAAGGNPASDGPIADSNNRNNDNNNNNNGSYAGPNARDVSNAAALAEAKAEARQTPCAGRVSRGGSRRGSKARRRPTRSAAKSRGGDYETRRRSSKRAAPGGANGD
jgi:hypothetical protein